MTSTVVNKEFILFYRGYQYRYIYKFIHSDVKYCKGCIVSQELRLVAVLELKPNSWEYVKNVIKECVKQSRLEAGNLFYSAHFEENNKNRIVFIEHWMSREAIEVHSQTAHFKQLVQIIGPYLEQPMQLLTLTEIQEIKE